MRNAFFWLTLVGLTAALCLAGSSRPALAGAPDPDAPITVPAGDPVDVPQSPGMDLGVYETCAFSNDVSDYRNP